MAKKYKKQVKALMAEVKQLREDMACRDLAMALLAGGVEMAVELEERVTEMDVRLGRTAALAKKTELRVNGILKARRAEREAGRRKVAGLWLAGCAAALFLLLALATGMSAGTPGETEIWSGAASTPVEWEGLVEAVPGVVIRELLEEQETAGRYAPITEEERELLARLVWLEARGESPLGQQAVAEVVLNRVAAANFPQTVEEVIWQGWERNKPQFSTAGRLDEAEPGEAQYAAVDRALGGEHVLPMDVVYFSGRAENGNIWGRIGGHVFCRQYVW